MGKGKRVRHKWKKDYEEKQQQAALIRSRQKRIIADLYADSLQDFLIRTYYTPLLAILNVSVVVSMIYQGSRFLPVTVPSLLSLIFLYLLVSALLNRVASSNYGTCYRDKQPKGYWIHIGIIALAYIFITAAGIIMAFGKVVLVQPQP